MTSKDKALKLYAKVEYSKDANWIQIYDEDEVRSERDNICFIIDENGYITGVEWLL